MAEFQWPARWPDPAEPLWAADLAAAIRPRNPAEAALIACLGGNSPYLAALARREPHCFDVLLRDGPDRIVGDALARLASLTADLPRNAVAAALRQAKRQVALASAVADIGGIWRLEQVTGALSRLAEAALGAAIRHLLWEAASRGDLTLARPDDPETGCGFVVLGMGKLGAGELNYSSDIDLILLYDPAAHPGREEIGRTFNRLAAALVGLLQTRDADGYVFRTDLRLRPDPASTPLAVALPSALIYYESHGQTWERAAMIKARAVAGDRALGQSFLAAIRPFVWRRHLDFAAIEDIHRMKRRIDGRHGGPQAGCGDLLGYDLKLGPGGIREVEFLAQTMQLVWGGRAPDLRDPTTLGTLGRLAQGKYMPAGVAADLADSYRMLRRVEHRLQMQDDRQTHSLPATAAALASFERFLGEAGQVAAIQPHLARTRGIFEAWFTETGQAQAAPATDRLDSDRDLLATLRGLGFVEAERAAGIVSGWRNRQLRALRSDRAQALLGEMLPALLAALAEQRDPILALVRFDSLLSRQSAGVQLLSLLVRNPPLLARIAFVLSAAPALAEHLAIVPGALEGLLVPPSGQQAGLLRLLDRQMRDAGDSEEAVRRARTLVRGEAFRLALAQMDARLDVDRAGLARTALAEHVIVGMLAQVAREHRARYGRIAGGGMVVVALGKAGSREMMDGSDLDLMLIYDHPVSVAENASQYYIRLTHSLIAALSAPGAEGPLYALDMRLRPSGSKGPVAVSLEGFRRYHAERSSTWERMALSRARVVAGPPALRARVGRAIGRAIEPPDGARAILLRDATAMRARLAADLPPRGRWDIKRLDGGLMEVEFIAQILQIAPLPTTGGAARVRHPTTRLALRRLARGGALSRRDAALLIEADRFWRALQSMLRILFGAALPPTLADATPALDALLQGMAASRTSRLQSLDDLQRQMRLTAAEVRQTFKRLIGDPTRPTLSGDDHD
ncbi:bifunctional [glutamine synthetase] adenylyltransferase/[glutamine synthetase]-adenylyl-L-tyrosine phosphorylase [Lichenicoccus sp.]|uniref:bifunctional [glutamine synthetase] adenylyltransferase/[glutamine synthetase]-adenylyl-L-tyrosine phosphorylase n=1 Tax=Lichenicoccus sp. TaxID=2781899 RepID=UPI003D10CBC4